MRVILPFLFVLFFNAKPQAQGFTASNLQEAASMPKIKFENYLHRSNYVVTSNQIGDDSVIKEFTYRTHSKWGRADSIKRTVTYYSVDEDFSFLYTILSSIEGDKIVKDFKKAGFYSLNEKDSLTLPSLFYQHNDFTVEISKKAVDTLFEYSFLVQKKDLPKPNKIKFAEDLLVFNSHEYLRFYFGDENVKSDVFFLNDEKVGNCTVLFPNSSKQAVFLWNDVVNGKGLNKIYIGGNLRTGGAVDYAQNIAENVWQLKNGIHAGMSLYTLRILNDAAFDFYGGKNAKTGMIVTESKGKINFEKDNVILGCINCRDNGFFSKTVINSDEALEAERILFVHTIVIGPDKKSKMIN